MDVNEMLLRRMEDRCTRFEVENRELKARIAELEAELKRREE